MHTTVKCTDVRSNVELGDRDLKQTDTTDERGWITSSKYGIGLRHDNYDGMAKWIANVSALFLFDKCFCVFVFGYISGR